MRILLNVFILVLFVVAIGCDSSIPEFKPKTIKRNVKKVSFQIDNKTLTKQEEKLKSLFVNKYVPLNYEASKNPFESVVDLYKANQESVSEGNPLLSLNLDQLKLVGILKSTFGNIGVIDANGNTFYVKVGDEIGSMRGKIITISEDMMVVRQTEKDIFGNVKTDLKEIYLTQKEGK
ncbi:conserved hypothetical protein [Deferribacter desulfuricans SSM1]|uniref:Type IV pilus assembly protein PilP n=1 Tax=Deferribacter desulfuricans (strain DSM 14783 / JCM 11476 / NBRC 101012 / SSM1) TaxID=639282 RepID=D3P8Z0_DEFDS|nr:pilus assembly protein PilP [Deferribacter desulfuricans]BAI81180.1 conserved hypothetical protein [Deferribacter desulfuricans SSM1]